MDSEKRKVWRDPVPSQFATVLASMNEIEHVEAFLRDVMTDSEIREISARLEAARMLDKGARYADVIASTDLSSRTVARVSDWLRNGCNGYRMAIDLLERATKK